MEVIQGQKRIKNVDQEPHNTNNPHVAILPCPGMSHLIPHLELAKRFCNFHDIQVTFFVYTTEASVAQSHYLNSQPLPESLHVYHLPSRDIYPFVREYTDVLTRTTIIISESLPDVESYIVSSHDKKKVHGDTSVSPLNVLVADCFVTRSFDIADKVGIPKYICFRFPLADGVLLNTSQDLEPKTIKALLEDTILQQLGTPLVYPVSPLVRAPLAKLVKDEYYMTWLNVGNNPDEYLPHEYQNRINGVGLVIPSWAPQVEILSHSSVCGFLSRYGWNSTLESICHGVPMIAWPLYAEQRSNSAMLEEEIGVAVRVKVKSDNGVVGREEIAKLVRLLMEEGNEDTDHKGFHLRTRAKQLQKLMIQAVNKGGSSYNSLSEIANEWKTGCNLH
ncbi:hypothetical protein MKW92_012450 [Papaver armeniacum]|nr:hypothetical protein MKW92_012450 [Papaver armeniacum]